MFACKFPISYITMSAMSMSLELWYKKFTGFRGSTVYYTGYTAPRRLFSDPQMHDLECSRCKTEYGGFSTLLHAGNLTVFCNDKRINLYTIYTVPSASLRHGDTVQWIARPISYACFVYQPMGLRCHCHYQSMTAFCFLIGQTLVSRTACCT